MKTPKKKTTKPVDKKIVDPAVAHSPNHASNVVRTPRKKLESVDRARRRLIERHGYAEDELKTLFKTDAELLAFYNDVVATENDASVEAALGWDMTDAMDAPAADKERYNQQKLDAQKLKFEQAKAAEAASKGEPVESIDDSPASTDAPSEPKLASGLTMQEFLAAGDDIDKLLSEDDTEEK